MLRFSALGWPNEQKFGELLTWPKVITPSKNWTNLSMESWETQHLKAKNTNLNLNAGHCPSPSSTRSSQGLITRYVGQQPLGGSVVLSGASLWRLGWDTVLFAYKVHGYKALPPSYMVNYLVVPTKTMFTQWCIFLSQKVREISRFFVAPPTRVRPRPPRNISRAKFKFLLINLHHWV